MGLLWFALGLVVGLFGVPLVGSFLAQRRFGRVWAEKRGQSEGDDWRSCVVTPEQRLGRLLELESKLAERHGLKGPSEAVRYWLIAMDVRGELVEDELVADWQGEFSSYIQGLCR